MNGGSTCWLNTLAQVTSGPVTTLGKRLMEVVSLSCLGCTETKVVAPTGGGRLEHGRAHQRSTQRARFDAMREIAMSPCGQPLDVRFSKYRGRGEPGWPDSFGKCRPLCCPCDPTCPAQPQARCDWTDAMKERFPALWQLVNATGKVRLAAVRAYLQLVWIGQRVRSTAVYLSLLILEVWLCYRFVLGRSGDAGGGRPLDILIIVEDIS